MIVLSLPSSNDLRWRCSCTMSVTCLSDDKTRGPQQWSNSVIYAMFSSLSYTLMCPLPFHMWLGLQYTTRPIFELEELPVYSTLSWLFEKVQRIYYVIRCPFFQLYYLCLFYRIYWKLDWARKTPEVNNGKFDWEKDFSLGLRISSFGDRSLRT